MNKDVFAKLIAQAKLHVFRRDTGEAKVEVLPLVADKGFDRLPKPDEGDLFFDMEGDPFISGGLEYLFGFISVKDAHERFTPFWAHSRSEEKTAFEGAIDFMTARLRAKVHTASQPEYVVCAQYS
jgi:predicted RecB family nuclease